MSRQEIRARLREARRSLPPIQHKQRSLAICQQIIRHPLLRRSQRVALFLSNDGEVDLSPLIHRLHATGKQCYLPCLAPGRGHTLWFAPYPNSARLQPNRYGIGEPIATNKRLTPIYTLDLVLMPLVAFDCHGNRLGMGGGYYDRSFAYLRKRNHWQKPRLIGTAFELQQLEAVPPRPWDVAMSGVFTERGFLPRESTE
ncbi:MAG: 5-formyltetrahydrofolate cyclo-ligase [Gammaproteobacteria bacterium]|nr:5-formyltetrahydrofolate cyclo-ligase [Gammaproteobacteria bacterium]